MHPLLIQLSALSAVLVLLPQLWGAAPLERTLGMATVTGLAVYGVLLVGQLVLRWVLLSPQQDADDPADTPEPTEPDAEAPEPSTVSA